MAKGPGDVLVDEFLDRRAGGGMGFRCGTMLKPVERGRGPGIITLEADLAGADRPRWWRRLNRSRLLAALHAFPEVLLGREELDLVEPVGGNLEDLELLIAEDHRQRCLVIAG